VNLAAGLDFGETFGVAVEYPAAAEAKMRALLHRLHAEKRELHLVLGILEDEKRGVVVGADPGFGAEVVGGEAAVPDADDTVPAAAGKEVGHGVVLVLAVEAEGFAAEGDGDPALCFG